MNFRPILFMIGILICVLSLSMIAPILIDLYMGHDDWKVFCLCVALSLFFGGSLILSNYEPIFTLNRRQAFLMILLGWFTASLFGALPFVFSELDMGFTDAFFESVSGVTTTGATVVSGLDSAPPGILIWRALLQWFGGLGAIFMAITIMPFLKIGGMQLFRAELAEHEKTLPRAAQLANAIALAYLTITLLCTAAYSLGGMGRFDALAHAMTTISTGGYSTHDTSLGYYQNPLLESISILFMICGAMPFFLILSAFKTNIHVLLGDRQIKAFLFLLAACSLISALYLFHHHGMSPGEALLASAFHTASLMTGTGFTTGNYNLWGNFIIAFFFFLTAIGGCAGSTSGGIKIFRLQIFFAVIRQHIQKLFYPNGVFVALYNEKPIPHDVPLSVISFLFLYAVCFLIIALGLSLTGVDVMTALSGAMSSLSNVGTGLGDIIGPAGNYESLPDSAKWILCAGMILGRVEIVAALIIFQPLFWKN